MNPESSSYSDSPTNPVGETSPDHLQQAWQAQTSQTRVTINANELFKLVQSNQKRFQTAIRWRDFTEVGLAILMIPVWLTLGIVNSLPWTWYLTVPVLIWWVLFLLVYRTRQKRVPDAADESLLQFVERSLTEQEDQIWLLKNVAWWYLLPPTISIFPFIVHVFLEQGSPLDVSKGWVETLLSWGMFVWLILVLFAIYYFIYAMNQYAIRSQLEPRRQEFLSLRASLRDERDGTEATTEAREDYPILTAGEYAQCSTRRLIISGMIALLILFVGIPATYYAAFQIDQVSKSQHTPDYPLRSPFTAVRWQNSHPEVQLNSEWFRLVSLNDLPASEIVEFIQKTYGGMWQKRFEEDLVEVLTRMGHAPQESQYEVKLVVESLTTGEVQTLAAVPMTSANRNSIKAATKAREENSPN